MLPATGSRCSIAANGPVASRFAAYLFYEGTRLVKEIKMETQDPTRASERGTS